MQHLKSKFKEDKQSVVTNSTAKKINVSGSIDESLSCSDQDASSPRKAPKSKDKKSKTQFLGDHISEASSQRSEYDIPWNALMSIESKSLEQTRKLKNSSLSPSGLEWPQ